MLYEFGAWWIGQLSDCIPKEWRLAAKSIQDCLTVTPTGPIRSGVTAVSVSLWSKNRETSLGEFHTKDNGLAGVPNPARLPVVLRLADSDVLCKTITLPAATERDLAQVLAFEMDRETPFAADDVLWGYRLIDRDKQRGQITLRLRLISRAQLASLLDVFAEAGISLARVEVAGGIDDGLILPIDTNGAQLVPRGRTHLRRASIALCVVFAALLIASPFIRQARDLAKLDQEIAASRGAAEQAGHLRNDIDRLAGAGTVVQKERAAAGDPLATLAALTGALPDDTYLTELQQQQTKVTFGGRSTTASQLIGAVAKSNELHNPVFVAPVTRMEATHQEVFSISVDTGP